MFNKLKNLFDYNRKEIGRLNRIVGEINKWEPRIKKLSDIRLKAKTAEFKKRIVKGEAVESLLPETFAVVREAASRTLGQRHYDVQLMAGIALFEGKIAEQKTGEGKTLTATLPLYLRALKGKGAHLVTVNDYLARIGTGWMGPVYDYLGLTTGCIIPQESFLFDASYKGQSSDWRLKRLKPVERKEAYLADITYGTNNEFGFDYLRDNMVQGLSVMVQRGHAYAIVDEVDFALIDEARTPLIISSPAGDSSREYHQYSSLAAELLSESDYIIDEKERSAVLTEFGIRKVERKLGVNNLYEEDFETIHHIENALKARTLFQKDKDYVIKDGQVIIVDEFTGRLMHGRRWSDGLHQAVEAKEEVSIQQESKTWATITFQNYFRLYKKLAGMTGTAATEAEEFKKIYDLDVVAVPTNKPVVREDYPDYIYKNQRSKYAAIAAEIQKCYECGQPVLVGTTSIEKNELVSRYLAKKKIPHQILNAKNHEKEAEIIAEAGKVKAITVATNMAGRGVDIILGGEKPEKTKSKKLKAKNEKEWEKEHEKVIRLGGLHVVGTERHEARRIDNQLRGRSGRQGDPGSSRFFVSLEDDLMRVFGGEQISNLMTRFKMPENIPLSHPMVSRVLEQIQIKVEGFNFDIRKSLVEYDDVVNKQREIIYLKRKAILTNYDKKPKKLRKEVLKILKKEIKENVSFSLDSISLEIDRGKLVLGFWEILPVEEESERERIRKKIKGKNEEGIKNILWSLAKEFYQEREKTFGPKVARDIEKSVYLHTLDNLWVDHLTSLDDLKEGVRLRGYGQRDPLVEYRKESFDLFQKLLANIEYHLARRILKIKVQMTMPGTSQTVESRGQIISPQAEKKEELRPSGNQKVRPVISGKKKPGRNDPCWCGSGKKYKKCHYPQTAD
ncbi:MAG: preprotein translocase subunit SecA [Candidatus Shapirobacteria bacterium]